ncbi:MAG: hypothetical protein AAGJ35_15375 [Myxococcota bacterium]
MWYVQDDAGFTREQLLKLYTCIEEREKSYREELYKFVNFYSAVCYAVLGLTLSGGFTLYTQKGKVTLLLLFGPVVALLMCGLALRVTARTYRRIISEVGYKAKLEHLMGLDAPLAVREVPTGKPIWSEDQAVIATKHFNRRFQEDNTQAFVDKSSRRGLYAEIRNYFLLIGAVTFGIAITLVVMRFAL